MKVDWVVVGAGFTGATFTERIASQLDQKVLVVERRSHVGGNAYDEPNDHGHLVHRYGPHIFHTSSREVWDYLSQFTDWRPYFHHVLGVVDGAMVPVPFNLNSLARVYSPVVAGQIEAALVSRFKYGSRVPVLRLLEDKEPLIKEFASYVYAKVFLGYTLKQWGVKPDELDASVTGRVPVVISRDDRYFADTYQAMPKSGYTAMLTRMLSHRNIRVLLNTDFAEVRDEIRYRRVLFTGPVDELLGFRFGHLPYRSLRFEYGIHEADQVQPVGTINYPNEFEFTRTTEQKHLTGQRVAGSTVVTEYPQPHVQGRNEPFYPVPNEANRDLHERYLAAAASEAPGTLVAGRLGDYRYYNMDQAVARALSLFAKHAANGT